MTQSITRHGTSRKRLFWALMLGGLYFLIVAIGSAFSNSLSLLAMAGHMMLHNGALIIGIVATTFAMKAPDEKFSSGYNKVEAIGGYTNGLLLLGVSLFILTKALGFFEEHGHDHHEIDASLTGAVALIGLVLHGISSIVLYKGRQENLCVNAAFFHIFFDVISSVAAIAVGIYVHETGHHEADLLVAGLIGILILINAVRIIKHAVVLLLDGTPEHIQYKDVIQTLKNVPHITGVHNLVIRRKDSASIEMSAHLVMHKNCLEAHHWNECRIEAEKVLKKQFNIDYCILQLEAEEHCNHSHA